MPKCLTPAHTSLTFSATGKTLSDKLRNWLRSRQSAHNVGGHTAHQPQFAEVEQSMKNRGHHILAGNRIADRAATQFNITTALSRTTRLFPAAQALAPSNCASVRPPKPKAPMRRNSRREVPAQFRPCLSEQIESTLTLFKFFVPVLTLELSYRSPKEISTLSPLSAFLGNRPVEAVRRRHQRCECSRRLFARLLESCCR